MEKTSSSILYPEPFHWIPAPPGVGIGYRPPYQLSHCGHSIERKQAYCWHGERRKASAFWQYTLAGEGELLLPDGTLHPQRPGDAMILTLPEAHCYRLPEHSAKWEFIYIGFHDPEAISLLGKFRSRFGSCFAFPEGGETLSLAREVLAFRRNYRPALRYELAAKCYRFLMSMFQFAEEQRRDRKVSAELEAVRDYCAAHPEEALTLERLAAMAGTSRWHFARQFKEAYGTSPGEYVQRIRMEYAAQLLRTTLRSVKEVAALCGFDSPGYFCKVYRRCYGSAPGSSRRQSRK